MILCPSHSISRLKMFLTPRLAWHHPWMQGERGMERELQQREEVAQDSDEQGVHADEER